MDQAAAPIRRRIAVIEDNPADANVLRVALVKTGLPLDIIQIDDGVQALAYFQNATARGPDCDLVLLDINLPMISGFEVLDRIKTDASLSHIPVIVLTSSLNPADIERCYRAGANSYFTKPLGLADFFALIEQLISYWLSYAKLPARVQAAQVTAFTGSPV